MKQIIAFAALSASIFVYTQRVQSQSLPDSSEYPYWIDMMQDPKANFFETQKAFELYWQNRPITKGCGWKPFKRWESYMETKVDHLGNKPAPDEIMNAYYAYKSKGHKSFGASDAGNWVELGPIGFVNNGTGQPNGIGRINCIAFDPISSSILYAGAPSGGFWKSVNGGTTWTTSTDDLPTLGVSSIVVNHSNGSTIYMGTGDRDGGDAPGLGVMKSTDAGLTWSLSNTGMGNRVVGKMVMHPTDTSILVAATNRGIYKTTDAGANWTRVTSSTRNYKDITFKPGSSTVMYATESGNFYRSTNTGTSWTLITSGLPTNSDRMVIGVSAANSSYVYCLNVDNSAFQGLYRSTDSGLNFTTQSTTPNIMDWSTDGSGSGGQGWYDLCIAVDPNNINVIYSGGVNIFKSTDGGVNWTINGHWVGGGGAPSVHADHHELIFSPRNGELYNGNDGGVYKTSNGGNTWTDISDGLAIAQVYKIGQSATSRKLVINGYQDNGTAIYNGSWSTEIGGDGMECIVDYSDTNYMYGALYYGDVRRSTNNGRTFGRIAADNYNGITESGAWVTPYILDNIDPNTMFVGYRNIWVSNNVKNATRSGIVWTRISNNLAGSNSNTIRVLEQSPANGDILYVARADDKLFRSDNVKSASPTWTNISSGLPNSDWPRDIEAHPTDQNKVWMVQSRRVYESNNKGASWTDITGSLPSVSVNCIVYDEGTTGNLYVGTDVGVFFKGANMTDWTEYNNGMPLSVEVRELEIYYGQNREDGWLKAATYGRGLWESKIYTTPTADISASHDTVCVHQSVQFGDESAGTYDNLEWKFPGGNPSSSKDRFPSIVYDNPGTYSVTLTVWNNLESDSIVKNAYITVDPSLLSVTPETTTIDAGESVTLTASGSSLYFWTPPVGLNQTSGSTVVASPTTSTTYFVHGDNGGSCDTAKAVVFVTPVGITELDNGGSIGLYPNPTTDKFFVDFKNVTSENFEIQMVDLTGKQVYFKRVNVTFSNQKEEVSTASLKKGIYIINIRGDKEDTDFKVVVQ